MQSRWGHQGPSALVIGFTQAQLVFCPHTALTSPLHCLFPDFFPQYSSLLDPCISFRLRIYLLVLKTRKTYFFAVCFLCWGEPWSPLLI